MDILIRLLRLDAMQGAGEEHRELYKNTAIEYRSQQRSSAPRTAGAAGYAGWQGSVAWGVR